MTHFRPVVALLTLYFTIVSPLARAADENNVIRDVPFGVPRADSDCRADLERKGGAFGLSDADKDRLVADWVTEIREVDPEQAVGIYDRSSGLLQTMTTRTKNATKFTIVRDDAQRTSLYVIVEPPNHLVRYIVRDVDRRLALLHELVVNSRRWDKQFIEEKDRPRRPIREVDGLAL